MFKFDLVTLMINKIRSCTSKGYIFYGVYTHDVLCHTPVGVYWAIAFCVAFSALSFLVVLLSIVPIVVACCFIKYRDLYCTICS